MSKDITRPVPQVTVAFRGIALQELEDEIGRVRVKRRPSDAGRALRNLLVEDDRAGFGLVEWRLSGEHFEYEHAKRVPVDTLVVSCVSDDLGANVSSLSIPDKRTLCARAKH